MNNAEKKTRSDQSISLKTRSGFKRLVINNNAAPPSAANGIDIPEKKAIIINDDAIILFIKRGL